MIKSILLYSFLLFFLESPAQLAPKSADEILKEATTEAAGSGKNVFIIFHASWCGWCHKMDSSMNDLTVKSFFDDNYIIRHLTVYESKGKEYLEDPGALELLKKYHGNDEGIPFWLIFNKKNELLADSYILPPGGAMDAKGTNTGCPASDEEVKYIINVIKKTSRLYDVQLTLIQKRFSRTKE